MLQPQINHQPSLWGVDWDLAGGLVRTLRVLYCTPSSWPVRLLLIGPGWPNAR